MHQLPYLRIRFPREQRTCWVTLSVPRGIERALTQSRLPDAAEALVPETETWVPLSEHPTVTALPTSQALGLAVATSDYDEGYELDDVVLLDPAQVTFLATARDQERRQAARNSVSARVSEPARIIVAGGETEEARDPGASVWRRHLLAVQRWAAAL